MAVLDSAGHVIKKVYNIFPVLFCITELIDFFFFIKIALKRDVLMTI